MRQGSMTVSKYAVHFSDLARHAPALVSTVRETVRQFIEGLHPSIRISMARELEMDISYQQVVSIARILEGMLAQDREEREAKRTRETSYYSGSCAPAACHGRGYMSHPVHSDLPAANGVPALSMTQKPYYAPPVYLLSPHYAILDCHVKTVTLAMPGFPQLEWRGTLEYTPSRVISFLKAQRMVEKGCDAYPAYVRDVSIDTLKVESVPVVRDFPDVFPSDL
ncbi:uncharacterized protein [Nicotiana tomentosiformis]|uniref:uncharacterized protein n=1 Tax=Nicotiana tomentosiformis TaxID=4098 RepID=UPI00388CA5E3